MTKKTEKEANRQEAITRLREILKPGDTVYTTLRHVSKSGMTRDISLHIGRDKNIQTITHLVATALNSSVKGHHGSNAIRMGGCGMDMGFALVYNLGRVLFPDGFIPREAGQSYGRNRASADAIDPDGGYALKQQWI